MCVVSGYTNSGSSDVQYVVTVKGAPETLKTMFISVPTNYEETYLSLSRRGARVLALGHRKLPNSLSPQDLRKLSRDELESNLNFVGFVIISCPLKPDSKAVIKEIQNASHSVVMITGDNPLTACHVSRELHFTKKPVILILTKVQESWLWQSVERDVEVELFPNQQNLKGKKIWEMYALCVTGEVFHFRDLLFKLKIRTWEFVIDIC